jgi:hypothetical protein
MSVPIRKPLSRKFNNVIFEIGRSPDLRPTTYLPIYVPVVQGADQLA